MQDWLLYPEDYNWRVEPDGQTNLRAVADIGTHWMDLAQFLIGAPIQAVNADLATFHPRRFKPMGTADTFSGSDAAADRPAPKRSRSQPTITRPCCSGLTVEHTAAFHVSQVTAGRKNRLTIEIAGHRGIPLLG